MHGKKWEGRKRGSECAALQGSGVHKFGLSLSQVRTHGGSFLVERSCMCSRKAKWDVIIASRGTVFPCVLTDVFVRVIFPLVLG